MVQEINQRIGTCQWCGAEYDKRHIVDGKLRNYRPLYCCDVCQREAKKQKERERRQRIASKKPKTPPKPKRNRDVYKRWAIKPGPASWAHCMGCPFQGWQCRSQDYPRCRHETQYKAACADVYAAYGEDTWL